MDCFILYCAELDLCTADIGKAKCIKWHLIHFHLKFISILFLERQLFKKTTMQERLLKKQLVGTVSI